MLSGCCEKISIDYAVMEKSDSIYVIASDLEWSDLGSWSSIGEKSVHDEHGNTAVGPDVRLNGCENCIVHASGPGMVVVNGLKEHGKLTLELVYIAFHVLAPDKGVLVGLGLYLRAVDILHIERDEAPFGQQQHYLCEDVVDFFLHTVAETVDGHEVGTFLRRKPDIMDVALYDFLYLAA